MANAKKDSNRVSTLIGVSSLDTDTPTRVAVNPSTNAMLVEASVSITGTPILDGVDSNIKATVKDLTNSNPLTTAIVDSNGDQISSFGGGTQYATNAAYADGNTGTLALSVRDDALSTLTEADGDYSTLRVTSTGRLWGTSVLEAGSQIIGKVGIDQTTPGTTNLVALTAETTKVLGVTRTADGAGNLLTSNSSTFTAKFGLDANLLGTLGTAFSTAGKVDVKGADGDVFVRQTTGSNLHTVLDSGTLTTVTTVTNLSQQGGVAISLNTGVRDTGTQRVTIATNDLVPVSIASGQVASGAIASGAFASGSIASGAVASGAIASGAIASGAIAVGAIAAGNTSIATTEDTARAGAEHLVKVGISRLDTPVANANVDTDGDYTNIIADNFGKIWSSGTVPEDVAHVAGEALTVMGARRIDTVANSAGTSADWATVNQTAEGALWATLTPTTTSGVLVANFNTGDTYTALTNSAQVIKASAGVMYGYYYYNPNSSATYILVYNTAAASVVVGTTTAQCVFCIPATSAANISFAYPIGFTNAGWSIAAATTGGGASAPAVALEVMVFYL